MPQILHLSDVHFGRPHRPEASAAIADWVAAEPPDLVVVSGDLTQRAKPRQFAEAREFVDGLAAPVLAVAGNHDVPQYRVWERWLSPLGAYRNHFNADLEPTFESDDLFVVGVNSAIRSTVKDGRVTRRQCRRLDERLSAAGERWKVVVVHHELVPGPDPSPRKVLSGAPRLAEVLSSHRVDLVLSGHLHISYLAWLCDYHRHVDFDVPLVHAGTASSDRGRGRERGENSCFRTDLADERVEVERFRFDPAKQQFTADLVWSWPRGAQG